MAGMDPVTGYDLDRVKRELEAEIRNVRSELSEHRFHLGMGAVILLSWLPLLVVLLAEAGG